MFLTKKKQKDCLTAQKLGFANIIIKGIVAPEIDPKCFGTFEKQATGTNPARGQCWT